jgi:drug/metabolite transporter (DMT)-like permease
MAFLLALLSSALWGSADFQAGQMSKKYKAFAVLGITQLIGLGFGIFLIFATGERGAVAFGNDGFFSGYFWPGAFAGVLGYIGLICLYVGLSTGRMGVVSPISSLGAVVPVLFALIGGEQLSRGRWIGVVIALAGAFCASGPEISQGFPLKPVALAFGAAFGFGTALTLMGIGSDSSALMTMVTMRATTALLTIAIAIKFRSTGGFSFSDAPSLIFIGVADFLANFTLGLATQEGLVSLVMVLGSLYPVVTVLLAFKLLHERLHKVQYVGVFLAVSGVAILSAFYN